MVLLYYFDDWRQNFSADKIDRPFPGESCGRNLCSQKTEVAGLIQFEENVMQLVMYFGPVAILDLLEFLFDDGGCCFFIILIVIVNIGLLLNRSKPNTCLFTNLDITNNICILCYK